MKTYKIFLLSLLVLISASSIFTKPGLGTLQIFNNDLTRYGLDNSIFVKYPPSTFLILSSVIKFFPPDPAISLFDRQDAWLVYKIVLYIFYLLSWLALLHLVKSSNLDISIAYFGSASIILSTLGLSFPDIFAVPFFILSISFLNKRKFLPAGLSYLLAISFNWTLLALFPIYFAYIKRVKSNKPIPTLLFFIIPLALTILFAIRPFFLRYNFLNLISQTKLFGFSLQTGGAVTWIQVIILILLLFTYGVSIGFLINRFLFRKILALVISLVLIATSIVIFETPAPLFLSTFAFVAYHLYKRITTSIQISLPFFLFACLSQYLSFLIFTQYSDGNLIWPVVLALILFIFDKSKFSFFQLILINILIFIKLFAFWSISGSQTVRGDYFEVFKYIFTAVFILFSIYHLIKTDKLDLVGLAKKWKILIIILLTLFNFSLIPAGGTGSDTFSWNQIAVESVRYVNPFRVQAVKEIDHLYPPLSTVIIGASANLWKNIIGPTDKYIISIKLSIIIFYALSVWAFLKFKIGKTNLQKILNRLLVILTTFSLIIQTQGFADINIYIVPSLILAILFLSYQNYFLSGLLLGITVSIKWQPIILLPLFGVYIFDLQQKFSEIFKRLLSFGIGFFIFPVIVWSLVYMQPGGSYMVGRSFNFILNGAAGLSGQALNLNWIATYILHIIEPAKFLSLSEIEWYNRIIPASSAPKILQGYLFLAAAGIILFRFWLFIKKNVYNFSKAALMIFLSHNILNKSAYEKHLFYSVVFMLLVYLIKPTLGNRKMLILIDVMTIMNLALFFGITGPTEMNRLFFGFDITIAFSFLYVLIYLWILKIYLTTSNLPLEKKVI